MVPKQRRLRAKTLQVAIEKSPILLFQYRKMINLISLKFFVFLVYQYYFSLIVRRLWDTPEGFGRRKEIIVGENGSETSLFCKGLMSINVKGKSK